jgi:hypothetical protein
VPSEQPEPGNLETLISEPENECDPMIAEAIKRLDESLKRLYKLTGLLSRELMEENCKNAVPEKIMLTERNLDAEIGRVEAAVNDLIQRESKGKQPESSKNAAESVKAIKTFSEMIGQSITPALKIVLNVAITSSAVSHYLLCHFSYSITDSQSLWTLVRRTPLSYPCKVL